MGLGSETVLGDPCLPWEKCKGHRERNHEKGRRTCCEVQDVQDKPWEVQGKLRRGLLLSVTASTPAQWLGITFSSQARAPRAGKVNTKIKTSEGCAFSGSDMQSNPMPQSLGRQDKQQALPWLAVCGAGRDRGLRREQGRLCILRRAVFPSVCKVAWSCGKCGEEGERLGVLCHQ